MKEKANNKGLRGEKDLDFVDFISTERLLLKACSIFSSAKPISCSIAEAFLFYGTNILTIAFISLSIFTSFFYRLVRYQRLSL